MTDLTLIVFIISIAAGFDSDESLLKRASATHSHNIMRFGRGGHNIMHFGKRSEPATVRLAENVGNDGSNEGSNELDTSSYSNGDQESNVYDPNPFRVVSRSPRTRYFIPHAFIGQ